MGYLVALTYVETEPERLALVALLEAHEIPCYVQGQGFGSLHPGIQVAHYNAQRILIPDEALEDARELLAEFRAAPSHLPNEFDWLDTVRCLVELFIGGWMLPTPRAHRGRPMGDDPA